MTRSSALDRLSASLDYPMLVVTAASRREVTGCLVGFFSQCSIHPLRYCVFLSKANHTFPIARRSSHLMVHLLDRKQHDLASHFGELTGDEVDKFDGVKWKPGPDGRTPRLTDVDAWIFGKVVDRHDTGDHVAHMLQPVTAKSPRRLRQLGFQDVRDLKAGH
jgi:flavin reductase (DIM6/NTAB) family NADH-FMN oxidoreductase RutF